MRLIQFATIVCMIVIVSSAVAGVTPEEQAGFNALYAVLLQGKTLTLSEVRAGMMIPMNSVLKVPWSEQPGKPGNGNFVTIAFKRLEVELVFLRSLFDKLNVGGSLPFATRGMEAVLTPEWLKVTFHEGVMIHLRHDMPGPPGSNIFVSENVAGVVIDVKGKSLISTNREIIREKFDSVWTGFQPYGQTSPCILGQNCFENPEGTVNILISPQEQTNWKYPRVYEPRVEE